MKKLIFVSSLLFLCTSAAFAQRTGAVSGIITDDATADKLPGAVVEFRSVADTSKVKHEVSGVDGKFTMRDLAYGEYKIRITFLGYEPYENTLTVNARNMTLANLFLKPSTTEIEGVNVVTQAIRTSMHGDTIVYNAHAFKTAEDADAEELLKQLPGVEVTADGQVKAQGKNISKIFVDGKETFGTDVTSTMRNIPANMIDKVEVYNKLSDFAETTGIQDGDDYQVMNFVTGIKFAQYGEYSALYGYKDMYALNAQHNIVTGNHGIRLNAGTNNTGQMSFGRGMFGDSFMGGAIAGMMGGGGYMGRYGGGGGGSANNKTKTSTVGLNYNYEKSENFRMSFNYRYGYNDNERKSDTDRRYFTSIKDSEGNEMYNHSVSSSQNTSDNNSHSAGGHINWKINDKQRLSFRFDGRYQASNSTSSSTSMTENLVEELAELFNERSSASNSSNDRYSFNGGLNYGINSLGKKGRSISVGLNAGINQNNGDRYNDFHLIRHNLIPKQDSTARTITDNDTRSRNVRARVQYSEPLSQFWNAMAVYDFGYTYSEDDDRQNKWNDDLKQYENYDRGSFIMNTKEMSHRIGPGIYYSKNRDFLRIDLVYKYTQMEGDRILPKVYNSTERFHNFVYNINYRMQFTPQKSLDFNIDSDTDNPSIRQLQDVDDERSYPYVSTGNPDLEPYYAHSVRVGYNSFNLGNSSNFNIGVNGQLTTGYIGDDVYIVGEEHFTTPNGTELRRGDQYSRPININKSSWSLGLWTGYGQPLNFIKSNMNLNASINYNESPGLVQGEPNTAKSQSYSLSASLNSNISTNFTFGVNYSFSPSIVNNTHKDYNSSTNISQNVRFNLYWRTWQDFFLRTDLSYSKLNQKVKGQQNPYRIETLNGNISLGKKIFKNKRGEITLAVNDVFDQNKYTNQSVQTQYIENSTDKSIGRYYSIGFRYQLRNFQKDGRGGDNVGERRTRPQAPANRPYRRMGGGPGGARHM